MRFDFRRLGEFDLTDRLSSHLPAPATQVLFGVFCALASIAARFLVDVFWTSAGPYSLIYPAILLSTLYGRWPSGLVTFGLTFLYAWYFVLPDVGSFAFEEASDGPRTVINGLAALVIVLFAEIFRRAVRRAVAERDVQIEARDLLLREINHRMKNNFAIVASLLEMQKRREENADAQDALHTAASRVHSFAAAHSTLYTSDSDLTLVQMASYLRGLADHLAEALFLADSVRLVLEADRARLPRDTAVALGIIVNELVTNAAKHAFPEEGGGEIRIEFRSDAAGWRLTVSDDGRGMPNDPSSGLGRGLVEAFAERAGGAMHVEPAARGTRVTIAGERAETAEA